MLKGVIKVWGGGGGLGGGGSEFRDEVSTGSFGTSSFSCGLSLYSSLHMVVRSILNGSQPSSGLSLFSFQCLNILGSGGPHSTPI